MDLIEYLSERLQRPIPLRFCAWRPGDQPVYVSDIRRAKQAFDWYPAVDWKSGVDKLIAWVCDNRDMLAAVL